MRPRVIFAVSVVVIALGASACGSTSDQALSRSLAPLPRSRVVVSTSTPPTTVANPTCTDPAQSLQPDQPLPAPEEMPAGSPMKAIQDRGFLIVGVDQGTLNWGYRDPRDGSIKGLDVDLLKEVARAIFGDASDARLQFKTVTTAQRIAAVKSGAVDMVASLLTATCARWREVDFSTVYYLAHQDVLVPNESNIQTSADLAGKRVCATRGSTSIDNIHRLVPNAIIFPVDTRTDCLVALQEGTVDALTSDDTILASFQEQDRVAKTRTLGQLEVEPYAIAIKQGNEDLVRFVNSVLERMRADGTLSALYVKWLGGKGPTGPPQAEYRP
jgi:polar amino acid transport system substrate-binding protein